MAETILVVAEQREGKLNRVSFETIAAAQQIAKHTGWTVEVVVPGSGIAALAQEMAAKSVAKVYALEAASLAAYTSDAYVFALKMIQYVLSGCWTLQQVNQWRCIDNLSHVCLTFAAEMKPRYSGNTV